MVLKRNLPPGFSSRLNPWEEAVQPVFRQIEDNPLPESLIGNPARPSSTGQEREPRNLLEAVQAAGRRRGLLPPEPDQEYDFPAIKRATDTLTNIFGRAPRAGDIIPANSVDNYLKALTADQFDQRDNLEFFNHVRDAHRLAYPTTKYDETGRMADTDPVAIPFIPWGEERPRGSHSVGGGRGTGMPGITKVSAPVNNGKPEEQPAPKDPKQPEKPEDGQNDGDKKEHEQCQYYRNDIAFLKQRLAQAREALLAQERALRNLEYTREHQRFAQTMGAIELIGEGISEVADEVGRIRGRGKRKPVGVQVPPKAPREIKIPPNQRREGRSDEDQRTVDFLQNTVETAEATDTLEIIEQKIKYTKDEIDILTEKIKWYIGDIVEAAQYAVEHFECPIEVPDPNQL